MDKKRESSIPLTVSALLLSVIATIITFVIMYNTVTNKINEIINNPGPVYDENTLLINGNEGELFIDENIEKIKITGTYYNITKIEVDKSNDFFYSKDNCVFRKDSNKLILGCIKSVIPKETTLISDDAFKFIKDSNMCALYYRGTIDSWLGVKFEECSPGYYFERVCFIDENNNEYEIESITFPDDYHIIPNYQFCNFKSLKEINFNNVDTIGECAFGNCEGIIELTVPNSVLKIGNGAFFGLNNLEKVSLPFVGNEQDIYNGSFGDVFSNGGLANTLLPESLKEVVITNDSIIEASAFSHCSSIEVIELDCEVRKIDSFAFNSCTNLKELYIPETVEFLGYSVLQETYNLQVYFKDTFEKFTSLVEKNSIEGTSFICKSFYEYTNNQYKEVRTIKIDNKINEICDLYFHTFSFAKEIYFGKNIKTIGYDAFDALIDIQNIYFNGTVEDWMNIQFRNLASNPKSVCTNVYIKNDNDKYVEFKDFVIPKNTNKIKAYTFVNFTDMTILEIPNTVTSIGEQAFYGMSNLEKLVTPFVGESSDDFRGLTYLLGPNFPKIKYLEIYKSKIIKLYDLQLQKTEIENLVIGDTTNQIYGENPFLTLKTLKNVYCCMNINKFLDANLVTGFTNNNNSVNYYLYDENNHFINFDDVVDGVEVQTSKIKYLSCFKNLKEITIYSSNSIIATLPSGDLSQFENIIIKSGTTYIAKQALSNFKNIKELYIPNTIVKLDEMAFAGLKTLEKVVFEEGGTLSIIPNSCFNACNNLKEINIPDSVLTIDNWAFVSCDSLNKVTFGKNSKLETINSKSFCACTSLKEFYIPKSVVSVSASAFDMCTEMKIYCPYTKEECPYSSSIELDGFTVVWGYN